MRLVKEWNIYNDMMSFCTYIFPFLAHQGGIFLSLHIKHFVKKLQRFSFTGRGKACKSNAGASIGASAPACTELHSAGIITNQWYGPCPWQEILANEIASVWLLYMFSVWLTRNLQIAVAEGHGGVICLRLFTLLKLTNVCCSWIYITDRADEIIWKRGLQNWRRPECGARGPESNFASRVSK